MKIRNENTVLSYCKIKVHLELEQLERLRSEDTPGRPV